MSWSSAAAECWRGIARHAKNAAVCLDNDAHASLHWNAGQRLFYEHGALCVTGLEHAPNPNLTKLIFVIAGPLSESSAAAESFIRASPCVYEVRVYLALSRLDADVGQEGEARDPADAVAALAAAYERCMGLANPGARDSAAWRGVSVELVAPITTVPVCDDVFFLAGCKGAIDPDAHEMEAAAAGLATLLGALDAKDTVDVWTCGASAAGIVEKLGTLPRLQGGRASVSLVVIDRKLDLIGPLLRQNDTLLDRVLASSAETHASTCDTRVDMSWLLNTARNTAPPGCLAHPECAASSALLSSVVGAPAKKGLLAVRKSLIETLSKASVKLPKSLLKAKLGRVTHKQLAEYLRLFTEAPPGIIKDHLATLQCAVACFNALEASEASDWDRVVAMQKNLLMFNHETMKEQTGESNAFSDILDIVPLPRLDKPAPQEGAEDALPQPKRRWQVDEILALVLICYSLGLANEDTAADEKRVQMALVRLLASEAHGAAGKPTGGTDESTLKQSLSHDMESAFAELKKVSQYPQDLGMATSRRGDSPENMYEPYIKQIVEQILDPARPELRDLKRHTLDTGNTEGGLLGKGMGMLGGFVSNTVGLNSSPGSASTMVFFVVGGVGGSEVQYVREAVAKHQSSCQILVGGTKALGKPYLLLEQVVGRHWRA